MFRIAARSSTLRYVSMSMSSSGARLSASVQPISRKVFRFWIGDDWENAPRYDIRPEQMGMWFKGGEEVDQAITREFGADCEKLAKGECDAVAEGDNVYDTIAMIIIGDQFRRNMFRNTPGMYTTDGRVLLWAKACLSRSKPLPLSIRMWVYLPFMHSERLEDQNTCVECLEELVKEVGEGSSELQFAKNMLGYAIRHKVIVEKYGRFPHRNAILGRPNTDEEDIGLRDGTIESF